MCGAEIGKSELEKDLGVVMDNRLISSKQFQAAAKKVSKILACIKKGRHG